MQIDEEKGLANTNEIDFAAPTRQGTFVGNEDQGATHYFPPSRVGTGPASITQPNFGPRTQPTSSAESLRSNATGPAHGPVYQEDAAPSKPGTRSNSRDEAPQKMRGRLANGSPEAAEKQRAIELGDWLVEAFKDDLFSMDCGEQPERAHHPRLTVSIAGLNRMRMRKLQANLVQKILHMRYEGTEPEGWEDLLKEYIEASKDSDYIRQCHGRNFDDPFLVMSDRFIDALVLKGELDRVNSEKRKQDGLHELRIDRKKRIVTSFAPRREERPEPIGGTRGERSEKQKAKEFLERLGFAIIGGVFLVTPMWLMVLHKTLYTSLVTTTVAVLLCGILTAWRLEGEGALNMVLSVTAAYAAVLVVFVGTNTPS